jgi:ribosomal protein L37AE/L43A
VSACQVPHCDSVTGVRGAGVCDDCWERRGRSLAALPALWEQLHLHLPPAQQGLQEYNNNSTRGGSRMPVNAAVLDALQAIPVAMMEWANLCRRTRGQEDLTTHNKRWQFLLDQAMRVLQAQDEDLHYSVYSVDYLISLFGSQSRMISLAGLAHLVHRLNATCPDCGRRELVRHNGRERVQCYRCGHSWSLPEYQRLVIVQSEFALRSKAQ